jgi:hypothetical protein
MALDAKEKSTENKTITIPTEAPYIEEKVNETMKGNAIELKTIVSKVKPAEIILKVAEKKNVQVKVNLMKDLPDILLPSIVKEDDQYKLETSDEICRNFFLKKEDDDPKIAVTNKFEVVEKEKPTEEEMMEEETCHGEDMGQLNDPFGKKMLMGSKSLKNNIINERSKMQEQPIRNEKGKFYEAREAIEKFFMGNMQELINNRKKLYNAKEEYRRRKLNNFCRKELCYEMDPFI